MNLTEAIEQLKEAREGYGGCLSDNYGAEIPCEHAEAIDLAITILSEQATVAPARRTDPATSHRAAPEEIKAGSAREAILIAANGRADGATPLTARELVDSAGLGYQRSPWKRVSELVKAGFLKPMGEGTDIFTGRQATTYAITAKGRAAARGILNP